ncbi:zinc finger, C2H2 type family protein (macronuclear) [Tetrahymena thermophila SB210]|uniref:Zinc finger, C2H2 type family protein n=1 Tax=Tetrahymena thermophila (strain SB210) TaxID=312017 RepID=I7LUE7_TETTS|nr:zinc finger, C2H2 type family protein [Tetrahymena thermophila SB210]EAR92909.2 zinc finger, C2H2 type family protein [Tetrahymena thermophila SB210]|eukprot:XP_001013154.2 zinc finger, C2H2 type family protein [Tetrahymena thermophila SB210]
MDSNSSEVAQRNIQTGKKTLHFGAMVYICFENERGEEFFTTAEGFTKNKIRLKQTQTMEKDANFTSGLFKILPPFYDNEYIKTKQVSDQKKQEKKEKKRSFNRRAARQEIPKQIKLMEEEAQLNYDQYEKLKGTPVLYGQTIQLLHHNSNKYLQFDQKSVSDFESDNLKVSLNEEYSEETQFRILPCFSYQQESQGLIFDQDTVYVVSTIDSRNSVGDPYLHASKDIGESQDQNKPKKKEMNVSTDKKSQWKIRIFCDYNDERNGMLSVCDIIWINYSEKDLNLLVQKITENEKEEKYLLRFEDCDSTEKYKKFVGNSNGMFVIESQNMMQGGLVEWDNMYRLRHLTTNQYLSLVVMGTNEVVQDDRCLVLQTDPEKASYFKFELIYSTLISRNRKNLTKYMQKDSYFRMSVKASSRGIKGEDEEVFWLKTADSDEFRESVREYQDVMNLNSTEKQIFPAFSTIKKEENVFKLNKASSNEVRMTEFLLSCRRTIKKTFMYLDPEYISYIDQGKFQQKYKKFLVMVGRLDRCLVDLNRFCHNKLRAYLYIDQEYGQINSFIQNVLREQLFIELLVSLLALAFPTVETLNEIKKFEEQKNRKLKLDSTEARLIEQDKSVAFNLEIQEEFVMKKKRVCTFIYKLLSSICSQNRKNQEKTSQFLPLFAMQSKYIPGCMECIFSIIKDYGDLLQNQLQTDLNINNIPSSDKQKQIVTRKFYTNSSDIQKISLKYERNYKDVTRFLKINPQFFKLDERWDMFEFFCYQLIETTDFNTKRSLLKFLGFASTDKGDGVNENQELIYQYLIPDNEEYMYDKGYLISIKSEGPELLVTHEQRKLVDIVKKQSYNVSKKMVTLELNQNNKKTDDEILSFFNDQMEFYSSMCNKRNNTWKKFVDKSCKFESLVDTIIEEKITYDIRAIICQLLNKLYVDQEPKRLKYLPELCKTLEQRNIQDWNEEQIKEKEIDQEDNQIKEKLINYIKAKAQIIEDISDEIKLDKQSATVLQEINLKVHQKCNDVYNNLTYEIVKMLRLMIDFGKYNIHDDISKFAKMKEKYEMQSAEFFKIISNILSIFEFDKTFPEARKILLKKREEEKQQAQNKLQEQGVKTLKKIFNFAIDIVGISQSSDLSKKKKKKQTNFEIMTDDINISDSFLKQTDVLKKILQRFFSDNQDDVEFKIKQEICEILKQFLNYKQDYMLNRLKYQFSYLVTEKLDTVNKLKGTQDEQAISQTLKEFKDTIQNSIDAFIPSVLLTGTEVDKKQEFEKQFLSMNLNNINSNTFSPLNFGNKAGKEAKDGDIININKILGFQILPSLILLFCFTQNYQMEEKLLQITTRFYNQRQEFATLASQLLILFDQENQQVLEFTRSIITSRLDKNVNESETWMKQLEEKENMKILKQTIKDIQFFADILCMGTKPDVQIDNKTGAKQYTTLQADLVKSNDIVIGSMDGQKKQNGQLEMDPIRQDIFYHNKVHILAISLIKDSIYLLEELEQQCNHPGNRDSQSKASKIYNEMKTLFKTCMTFLRNFVQKNSVNQNLLSEYLEKLHKALPFEIGLMELYWEIFRDNKKICLENQEKIAEDFISLIQKNGRQAKYLEFFIIIQKANEEHLIKNQKFVLNLFLNDKYKKDLLYLADTEKLSFEFRQIHPNDEPYMYHSKLLQVLGMTTIGKEGMYMSEQKLRSQITLRYVFDLLSTVDNMTDCKEEDFFNDMSGGIEEEQYNLFDNKNQGNKEVIVNIDKKEDMNDSQSKQSLEIEKYDKFEENQMPNNPADTRMHHKQGNLYQSVDPQKIILLKVPLLNYIYYTFLESEKISDEFNKYIADFIDYIRFEVNRINFSKDFSEQYYEYLNAFLFILCAYKKAFANTMHQTNIKPDVNQKDSDVHNINKELANLTKAILGKQMIFLKKEDEFENFAFKNEQITLEKFQKYKQRWKIFRSLVEGQRSKANKFEEENEKLEQLELQNQQSSLVRKKTDKKIVQNKSENLGNKLLKQMDFLGLGKKEVIEIDPECTLFKNLNHDHVIWQRLWSVFLDQFLNSAHLKQQIDTEHTIFAQALDQVENIFKESPVVSEVINKNEIFKKLIKYLQKSYKEQNEIQTFRLILCALRNFIQPPEDEEKELDQKQEQEKQEEMENNQNFLNQNNATYMLMSLLSDHSNPKQNDAVFADLIHFGIVLLEDGNNEVQKSVYTYFMNFTSSEVFFKRIHTILTDEIIRLKRDIVDNSQENIYYFQKQNDIVYSILRFLQLFAEGHNLDLQKYMRLQTQNYHNFDLIEVIIELLNNYFKKKCIRYIKNMTQCFDTLTEYIQGPCKENQHALIQDNFLDLASSLFGIDEIMDELNYQIQKEKENEKKEESDIDEKIQINKIDDKNSDQLPRWEVAKLKYKCSITLISLLEARSKEDDIVPRMMKTLNIDIIRRNITDIYNQFVDIGKGEYVSDVFNHFELEPTEESSEQEKNQASFIIETGFNLFILLSTFKEVSKDEEDQIMKKKRKKKEGKEEENLLKNNIISEVLQMVFNFIASLKNTVQEQANNLNNLMKTKQKENWHDKKMKIKQNRDQQSDTALKFFEKHTLHIEVLRENDNQLEKAYFYLPYFCQDLDKDTKTNFNRNANRISVKAKVTSLASQSDDLIQKMRHNYQLHKWLEKVQFLLMLKEKIGLLRNLAFLLAIAINLMVLFSFERVQQSDGSVQSVNLHTESAIQILGVILIVLSVIVVLYFLALNAPLLIMKAWEGFEKYSLIEYTYRMLLTVYNLLSDFYVLYYVIYGLTAIVGTIVSPFFFFFHLFDVLVRFPDLLNVVKAVWIPKKAILFTYFLFLVLMYVFTLFGYYWLYESYPGDFCESTFVCLLTAIDRSFKFDGGLGGYLNPTTQQDSTGYFLVRFFFDNLYYILLMIIMINIVSGIIIDQFGEGRDELRVYNQDLIYKCFICGFSNEEIEKNSDQNQDFKSHIKEDHYMWNYLYYIAYLKDKTKTEYTGIESYVADKLAKKEITWFPTNRALCMSKNVSVKQNQEIFTQLQDIAKSQDKIRQTLDQVNTTLDQFQVDNQGEVLKNQHKKKDEILPQILN